MKFAPITRGCSLQAAAARFSLTANEVFIKEQSLKGVDVREIVEDQEELCYYYGYQFGGKAIYEFNGLTNGQK